MIELLHRNLLEDDIALEHISPPRSARLEHPR